MTITDHGKDMANISVADLALNFPSALAVLNKYNLDYCCNGKTSFIRACEKANIDAEKVWQEILEAKANVSADNRMRFDTWQPDLLIDFILQHHHVFVREAIPQIRELLEKVCSVHGTEQPELFEVRNYFNELAEELLNHLPKEEEILFPAIKRLMAQTAQSLEESPLLSHLQAPIMIMEHEHDRAGQLIKLIRSLTKNYETPPYACPTFCLTYKLLEEFETDLMQHIHLENNILFPKVSI